MTSQLRLQLVVPVVVFAVLALGLALFLMSRNQPASEAAPSLAPVRAATPLRTPAVRKPAASPPKRAPAPPKGPVLRPGLPSSVAAALRRSPIVVVSLVAPRGEIDATASAEARVGAGEVKAGFVALDVTNERQARPLTQKLGVLEAPAVLVFERPGDVFVHIDGFVDRETVAQAAQNARS